MLSRDDELTLEVIRDAKIALDSPLIRGNKNAEYRLKSDIDDVLRDLRKLEEKIMEDARRRS